MNGPNWSVQLPNHLTLGIPLATNFGYYVSDDTPCANRSSLRFVVFYTSCCVNDHFEALRSHMDHLPLRFQKLKCHLSQEYFEYGGQALVLTLQEGCEGKSWRRFVVK